jgi:hypothetical protein
VRFSVKSSIAKMHYCSTFSYCSSMRIWPASSWVWPFRNRECVYSYYRLLLFCICWVNDFNTPSHFINLYFTGTSTPQEALDDIETQNVSGRNLEPVYMNVSNKAFEGTMRPI